MSTVRATGLPILVAAVLAAVAGCGGEAAERRSQESDRSRETTSSPPGLEGSRAVSFRRPDGIRLEGRVFGEGRTGVVLLHGYDSSGASGQDEWFPFAPVLKQEGYRVLTFNFQGYCPGHDYGCSKGHLNADDTWRDVGPAVDFLHSEGVDTVFLVGASMGGMMAVYAAAQPDVEVAGVVTLSTPRVGRGVGTKYVDPSEAERGLRLTDAVVRAIAEPKLFVVGKYEDFVRDAVTMYRTAAPPKRLVVLPTGAHGSDALTGRVAYDPKLEARARKLLLAFLARNR